MYKPNSYGNDIQYTTSGDITANGDIDENKINGVIPRFGVSQFGLQFLAIYIIVN